MGRTASIENSFDFVVPRIQVAEKHIISGESYDA